VRGRFLRNADDDARVPVELPKRKNEVASTAPVEAEEVFEGPLVAPSQTEEARRYYFVVPISPRGREGPPSDAVSVPFGEAVMRWHTGHRLHGDDDEVDMGAVVQREDMDHCSGAATGSASAKTCRAGR
jgi:hypothetical protein